MSMDEQNPRVTHEQPRSDEPQDAQERERAAEQEDAADPVSQAQRSAEEPPNRPTEPR